MAQETTLLLPKILPWDCCLPGLFGLASVVSRGTDWWSEMQPCPLLSPFVQGVMSAWHCGERAPSISLCIVRRVCRRHCEQLWGTGFRSSAYIPSLRISMSGPAYCLCPEVELLERWSSVRNMPQSFVLCLLCISFVQMSQPCCAFQALLGF